MINLKRQGLAWISSKKIRLWPKALHVAILAPSGVYPLTIYDNYGKSPFLMERIYYFYGHFPYLSYLKTYVKLPEGRFTKALRHDSRGVTKWVDKPSHCLFHRSSTARRSRNVSFRNSRGRWSLSSYGHCSAPGLLRDGSRYINNFQRHFCWSVFGQLVDWKVDSLSIFGLNTSENSCV